MVRLVFGIAAMAMAAHVAAQYPEEIRIFQAFDKLRAEDQFYVNITGTDKIGSATNTFQAHIYWFWDTSGSTPAAKVQVLEVRNGVTTHRIVGNGDILYDYDLVNHQFSATNYGGFGSARPETYIPSLMHYLSRLTRGQEVWGTRLLREVHDSGSSSAYRSWMPGIRPVTIASAQNDPVVPGWTFVDTPTVDYIQYSVPNKRSVTFELEDDPPSSDYRLKSIYFGEQSTAGGKPRMVSWQLTPYKGIAFDPKNFAPYTYDQIRGWRTVVGPQPFKG